MNIWYPGSGLDFTPVIVQNVLSKDANVCIYMCDNGYKMGYFLEQAALNKSLEVSGTSKFASLMNMYYGNVWREKHVKTQGEIVELPALFEEGNKGFAFEMGAMKDEEICSTASVKFYLDDAFKVLESLIKSGIQFEAAINIGHIGASKYNTSKELATTDFFTQLDAVEGSEYITTLWTDMHIRRIPREWTPTDEIVDGWSRMRSRRRDGSIREGGARKYVRDYVSLEERLVAKEQKEKRKLEIEERKLVEEKRKLEIEERSKPNQLGLF